VRYYPLPRPGDIVWCRFPADSLPGPALKPRPALVLQTGYIQDNPVVTVAYGTSRKVTELYTGEFAITPDDGEAFTLAGLSYPTKSNLGRIVDLPYNAVWFGVPPTAPYGQIPKLGVLHPHLMRRVEAAYRAITRKG